MLALTPDMRQIRTFTQAQRCMNIQPGQLADGL
jgi:hypothetical protein